MLDERDSDETYRIDCVNVLQADNRAALQGMLDGNLAYIRSLHGRIENINWSPTEPFMVLVWYSYPQGEWA